MLFCCFVEFLGKFIENLFFIPKIDYLRMKLKNLQKDYFSQHV